MSESVVYVVQWQHPSSGPDKWEDLGDRKDLAEAQHSLDRHRRVNAHLRFRLVKRTAVTTESVIEDL